MCVCEREREREWIVKSERVKGETERERDYPSFTLDFCLGPKMQWPPFERDLLEIQRIFTSSV